MLGLFLFLEHSPCCSSSSAVGDTELCDAWREAAMCAQLLSRACLSSSRRWFGCRRRRLPSPIGTNLKLFVPELIFSFGSQIYVTLKANPPQIHSNLTFIQRFCDPEVLSMENLCFYTHLVFAVSFIEIIEASSLSISPEEFEKRMSEPESTRDEN